MANLVFIWRYGLRKWKARGLQSVLLCFSLSLLVSLFSMGANLNEILSQDRPNYIHTQQPLLTVGQTQQNGLFTRIRGFELEKLAKVPGIEQVVRLAHEELDIRVDNRANGRHQVMYFSPPWVSTLKITGLYPFMSLKEDQAVISAGFARRLREQGSSLQQDLLQVGRSSKKYTIIGIVPESLSRLGKLEPDIWLAQSELAHIMPFRLSIREMSDPAKVKQNQLLTERYLRGLPLFYGFAIYQAGFSIEQIQQGFQRVELDEINVVGYRGAPATTSFEVGFNLDPQGRKVLHIQWQLLAFLLGLLLMTVAASLLFIQNDQLLTRRQELVTRLIVGASVAGLRGQLILEQFPLIIMTACLGGVLLYVGVQVMYYLHWMNSASATGMLLFHFSTYGVGVLVVSVLVMGLALVPTLGLNHQLLFSREQKETLAPRGKYWLYLNGFFQLCIGLILTLLMLLIFDFKLEIDRQNTFKLNTLETQVFSNNVLPLDQQVLEGDLNGFDPNQVMVAGTHFVSPRSPVPLLMWHSEAEQKFEVRSFSVAPRYFKFFNIQPLTTISPLAKNEIVLNQAAADLMLENGAEANYQSLVGQIVYLEAILLNRYFDINSVVANAPHFGFIHQQVPVVYRAFSGTNPLILRWFTLYYSPDLKTEVRRYLENWSDDELGVVRIEHQDTVVEQLYALESDTHIMQNMTLILALVLWALCLFNINHVLSAFFIIHRHRIGIGAALGLPKTVHYLSSYLLWLGLLCLSFPPVQWVFELIESFLYTELLLPRLNVYHLTCAYFIVGGVLLVGVWVRVTVLLRRPVRDLLSQ